MDASQVSQITEMMYALRNPAGIPTYPIIFMVLGVITFALHIFFVQLMLGTSAVTIFGSFKNDAKWRRLAAAMLEIAKVSVSVAIVLGVAPLLFVQVLYDPNWYTSNVLSADWVIAFIFILIIGYWAMYMYYFMNSKNKDKTVKPRGRIWMLASIALMLVVGFIMHSLSSEMLHPELWKSWYSQNGILDYSGSKLHAHNLWRYAFFISIGIPIAGAMLVSYRRFKMVREDADMEYLDWAAEVGKKWILVGSVISFVLYVAWMMTIPKTAGDFATSLWAILGGIAVLLPAIWSTARLRGNSYHMCSYMALPIMLVSGLLITISREMLRYTILNGFFHYNFMDYKVVFDSFPTFLFFETFIIVGGVVLSYYLTIAWKAGQTVGVYTPGPGVNRLGTISIWIMALWTIQFFAAAAYVMLR